MCQLWLKNVFLLFLYFLNCVKTWKEMYFPHVGTLRQFRVLKVEPPSDSFNFSILPWHPHKNSMHPADKSTSVCIQHISSITNNYFIIWLRHLNTEFPLQYIFFTPVPPVYLLRSDNKTPYWKYPADGQRDASVPPKSLERLDWKIDIFLLVILIFKKKNKEGEVTSAGGLSAERPSE